jgi:negative regulator of sigma E activity
MSDSIKQSLSALMDDEAGEFELRKTLGQLDPQSAAVWSRYHVARSALKGDAPVQPPIDISVSVMAALEHEPTHSVSPGKIGKKPAQPAIQWRSLGGMAVAASVTMMIIFGAQTYQGGALDSAVSVQSQLVLSAPTPIHPSLMPAQYGEREAVVPSLQQADVIRWSSSMEYYIDQHRSLTEQRASQWQVGWIPKGYQEVEHDRLSDAEVILYSNDRTTISISVQPYAAKKASPGAIQSGDTVAVGKQVGDQFVTVVGDVPFMMADRIASSIVLKND